MTKFFRKPTWLVRNVCFNAKHNFLHFLAFTTISILSFANASTANAQSISASVTGQNSFCPGSSASLSASYSGCTGSASFVWKRNGVTMPGFTTSTVSVSDPGSYTVTVTCGIKSTTSAAFNLGRLTLKANVQNACPGSTGNINLRVIDGKAPFTYLWNNGQTTQDVGNLVSGNYSVSVKDANGCVATTIATVKNTPVNVSAGSSAEICSGGSAQLQASGADLYFWSPSTGLSASNVSNPVASPASTTLYTLTGFIASGELVTNGDFKQGNTGFLSDYANVTSLASPAGYTSGTGLYPEGKYAVITNRTDSSATKYHPAFEGSGHNKGNAAGRNDDRYIAINGSTTLDQAVWKQSVEVVPGNTYSFSCWITSLLTGNPSKLRFLINGVEVGPRIEAPSTLYTWKQFYAEWNSGTATSADIAIINDNLVAGGNDFGLDDISFSTTCKNTSTVLVSVVPALSGNTINCPDANTFCLSGNAGIITGNNPSGGNGNYAYQWQISLDNTNWADIDGATSSSYDPGTVFATTRFRRIVKSSSCSIESNVCTITITTGNTISNNSITAPGTATFCASGNPSAISGSSPFGGGSGSFVYTWLSSDNGIDFEEIAGAKSASYDPGNLTQTTYFRRVVTKGNCNSNASNIITITINQKPEISLVSSASICGSGRGSLEVSATGATIKWYETSTSNTVLGTGAVYTTPNLTGSATYYAQATLNNCVSDRLAVSATVKTLPTVVSTTGGSTCGIGNVSVSAVPSAGTIVWYSSLTEGSILGNSNTLNLTQVAFNSSVFAEAQNDGCISAQRSIAMVEVKNPTSSETTLSACESLIWNEETYTSSGDYEKLFVNAAGCDSTAILHLTITPRPAQPEIACWQNATFNNETCSWDVTGVQPTEPTNLSCWQSANFNTESCSWVVTGTQPTEPTNLACWQSANFNTESCSWVVTGTPNPVISSNLSACDNYNWSVNGNNYTASGKYLATVNCQDYELNLTINLSSQAPTGVQASATQTNGSTAVTLTVQGGNLGTNAVWKWFTSACGGTSIGSGASISVTPSATTTYFVRAEGTCNTTACKSVTVTVNTTTPTCGDGRYAEQVVSFRQQKAYNGTAIVSGRSQSSKSLCSPQNNDTENFVSLGFGGDITLKFGKAIRNGAGNDIRVYESTFGNQSCAAYPEKARVFASQDGCRFVYLGELCQDGSVDLGALNWAQYVRIVDVSSKAAFANISAVADGFDVDAVEGLNGFETNPVVDAVVGGATEAVSYLPGKCRGGANISTDRTDKNKALGAPQGTNVVNFVSLGFGGKITLRFKYAVENNPTGLDLQVVETSYGNPSCNSYPEKARFEGSLDGASWTDLGELCQDGKLEMGTLPYLHYIRITDVSDKTKFGTTADGYDVDGVLAINQCTSSNTREAVEIVDDINTADELEIAGMLELYPNPATESATFSFSSQNESAYGLNIVNALGQVVYSTEGRATEGVNTIVLNLENLSKGLYIVQLVQDGSMQQKSLVKK